MAINQLNWSYSFQIGLSLGGCLFIEAKLGSSEYFPQMDCFSQFSLPNVPKCYIVVADDRFSLFNIAYSATFAKCCNRFFNQLEL